MGRSKFARLSMETGREDRNSTRRVYLWTVMVAVAVRGDFGVLVAKIEFMSCS